VGQHIPRMDADEKEAFNKLQEEVNQNNKKLLERMYEELKRQEDNKSN